MKTAAEVFELIETQALEDDDWGEGAFQQKAIAIIQEALEEAFLAGKTVAAALSEEHASYKEDTGKETTPEQKRN